MCCAKCVHLIGLLVYEAIRQLGATSRTSGCFVFNSSSISASSNQTVCIIAALLAVGRNPLHSYLTLSSFFSFKQNLHMDLQPDLHVCERATRIKGRSTQSLHH